MYGESWSRCYKSIKDAIEDIHLKLPVELVEKNLRKTGFLWIEEDDTSDTVLLVGLSEDVFRLHVWNGVNGRHLLSHVLSAPVI